MTLPPLSSFVHGAHPPLIALLTDFGTRDPYVGIMKGVIAARCPGAMCIDLTHEVTPQQVTQGAYLLRSAYRYFPPYTVFLGVVDPGVGTARRAVAIQTVRGAFVGPDNGLFSLVLAELESFVAVELRPPHRARLSNTFQGRDLFAPAAADLAGGLPITQLGTFLHDLVQASPLRLDRPEPNVFEGEVIHIDRFGNVITSLGPFDWNQNQLKFASEGTIDPQSARVYIGQGKIETIQRTYGESAVGTILALISSDGQLEIAVNQGSAAEVLKLHLGDRVRLEIS